MRKKQRREIAGCPRGSSLGDAALKKSLWSAALGLVRKEDLYQLIEMRKVVVSDQL
jgi:hypothetical protein